MKSSKLFSCLISILFLSGASYAVTLDKPVLDPRAKINNSILATRQILNQEACYAFLGQNRNARILNLPLKLKDSICGEPLTNKLPVDLRNTMQEKLQNLAKQAARLSEANQLSMQDFNAACKAYNKQMNGKSLIADDNYSPVVNLAAPSQASVVLVSNYAEADVDYQQLNHNLVKFFVIKNNQIQCQDSVSGNYGSASSDAMGIANLIGKNRANKNSMASDISGDVADLNKRTGTHASQDQSNKHDATNSNSNSGSGGFDSGGDASSESGGGGMAPLPVPGGISPGNLPDNGGITPSGNNPPGVTPSSVIPSKPSSGPNNNIPVPDGGNTPSDPNSPTNLPVNIPDPAQSAFVRSVPDPSDPFGTGANDACVAEVGMCKQVATLWDSYQQGRNQRYQQPFAERPNYNQLWLESSS